MTELLLANNAHPNAKWNDGSTPLHMAATSAQKGPTHNPPWDSR